MAKAAQRFKLNSRLLHGFALALIGVVAITPMATGLSNTIHLFSLTNIHVALWRWTDTNIPLDGRIMLLSNGEIENTWSRNWSGYDGVKSFQWWYIDDDLTPSTPQIYSDRGITYLAVTDKDLTKSFMVRPDVVALLKQLVLIKTIPGAPQNSGPTVYFYRMLPPQHSVNANFGGEISLIGYDLNHDTFNPGDTVHFRPYWRSLQRPRSNYSIFVHMVPENVVTTVAQYDGPPTTESRPTLTWDDTAELYIGSDDTFTIPPGTAPGNYMLQIGLYDYNTGQRLKISDSADSFTIPLVVQ